MEHFTREFARCANCALYYPAEVLVDMDGDGGAYCPDCADTLLPLLLTRTPDFAYAPPPEEA